MSLHARTRHRPRGLPRIPLQRLPQPPAAGLHSTWRQARSSRIEESLRHALEINPGGWLVAGTSADVQTTSVIRNLKGREVVLWRAEDGSLHAGPGACPHLGAQLSDCVVVGSDVVCRWHGMALPREAGAGWREFPAHDDGVLVWVRLPDAAEPPTELPVIPERPAAQKSLTAVICRAGRCDPEDIIANRLDPWHGAWFHPYAFSHLAVDEDRSDVTQLTVEVAFRINRRWGVPVVARFTTPDARTIVMRIIEGEGEGSVVETHATPLGHDSDGWPQTMMTEATIAHSPGAGFQAARLLAPLIRPAIRRTAGQLWVDDLAYAERRYLLRREQ